MSFAHFAKEEVLQSVCQNECCKLAELSAIIHSCGELKKVGSSFSIQLRTDMEGVFPLVNDVLKRLYGKEATYEIDTEETINKSKKYIISIDEDCSKQIMFDCGLAKINLHGEFELIPGIDEHIIENDCCAKAYIKGVFIVRSTSGVLLEDGNDGNKKRTKSGYHWEFDFETEAFANDFSTLLFSQGISSKKIIRKNLIILYIKDAEIVSDLLATVGAFKSVLQLHGEIALRQVRNNINRQNNCISANIAKTVGASIKQLNAIDVIQNSIGLEALPQSLRELCLVRLANPEESLSNLTKLVSIPITKSGINHQMRKIITIAQNIEDQKIK